MVKSKEELLRAQRQGYARIEDVLKIVNKHKYFVTTNNNKDYIIDVEVLKQELFKLNTPQTKPIDENEAKEESESSSNRYTKDKTAETNQEGVNSGKSESLKRNQHLDESARSRK